MTLIFNFCALGAAIICFEMFSRYWRYKGKKTGAVRDFYLAFSFVGLGYIALSLPQLILFDPFWIQMVFILEDVLFLISMIFFGPAVLGMSDKWSRFKKTLSSIILLWTGLYVLFNVFFFSPAVPLKTNNIVYFWKSGTFWIQGTARGLLVGVVLVISTLFFAWSKRISPQKKLSWRAFFSALGALTVAVAGSVFWFFPFFYFSPALLVFSGCLGFLGFLVAWIGIGWIRGIVLRPVREEFVKKIT